LPNSKKKSNFNKSQPSKAKKEVSFSIKITNTMPNQNYSPNTKSISRETSKKKELIPSSKNLLSLKRANLWKKEKKFSMNWWKVETQGAG
jgi:hypothetical protein